MIAVNCYIECKGMYRFSDDPEWGHILRRFREGTPVPNDFDVINSRVVNYTNKTLDGDSLPSNVSYATYSNVDRDAINTGVFEKFIQKKPELGFVVFADQLACKKDPADRVYYEFTNKKMFWDYCSESDCFFSGSSQGMDPVLKLFSGCPVMLTRNIDVSNNKANGTVAFFYSAVAKPKANIFSVKIGDRSDNSVRLGEIRLYHSLSAELKSPRRSGRVT